MIGVPCYLDVSNLADLRELFASGVHVSEVFVLLLTEGVLTRPWCLLEIHEAKLHRKPIVLLSIKGKRFAFDDAFEMLRDLEGTLPALNPYAIDELRAHIGSLTLSELGDSVREALETARTRSVRTLNLNSTTNQLEAQLVDLVGCMSNAAGRPPVQWNDHSLVRGRAERLVVGGHRWRGTARVRRYCMRQMLKSTHDASRSVCTALCVCIAA